MTTQATEAGTAIELKRELAAARATIATLRANIADARATGNCPADPECKNCGGGGWEGDVDAYGRNTAVRCSCTLPGGIG